MKFDLLGVPPGPVVTEEAAMAMAPGPAACSGPMSGSALTGVAGPTEQEGMPVGTLCIGLALGEELTATTLRLPGPRLQMRQLSVISALDLLRRRLLAG